MGCGKSWRRVGKPSWFMKDGTMWVSSFEVDDRGLVRVRSHPVTREQMPKRRGRKRKAKAQPTRNPPRIRPPWLRVIEGGSSRA
jgi:hypothetical protein